LQDAINKNNMNNTHFEEIEMLRLFREICVGVRVMHTFRGRSAARIQYEPTHAMTHEEESRQDQALLGGSHQEQSTGGIAAEGKGEVIPWAHRDIKPG
jgi:serine/threonine kinase 16